MEQWIVQTLNGISFGMILFLMAAGLSVMLGLMGIANLAHGSYFVAGTYVGASILGSTGNFLLALLGGSAVVAIVGVLMERFLLRRLHRDEMGQVLLTFGFVYLFLDLSITIWGGAPRYLKTPDFLTGRVEILGLAYPLYRMVLTVAGLAVALLLWLLIEKTKVGAFVRAGVDDKEMAMGLGVNIPLISTIVFALGAFLAGLGGVAAGPIIGAFPGLDIELLLLAMVVIVVGGAASIPGALIGSLAIGLLDTFGKALIPELAMFTIFGCMAIILVIKPSGLFGKSKV